MRLLLLALVLAAQAGTLAAQDTTFNGVGNWNSGNWDMGIPTLTDFGEIASSSTANVNAASEARTIGMNFGSTINVNVGQTLTVAESINTLSGTSSTINVSGNLIVGTNGAAAQVSNITNSGGFGTSGSGNVTLRDNVVMTVTTSSSFGFATLNNAGSLTAITDGAAGEYQQRGNLTNTGTFIRSTDRTWTMNNSSIDNSGTFESVGAFVESGAGTALTNSGTFVATAGTSSFTGVDVTNTGSIIVRDNASFSILSGTFTGDNGTVSVEGNGSFSSGADLALTNATLTGTGTVTDNLSMTGGSISPGENAGDIGVLSLGGDVGLDAATTLTIDLATGSADRLAVGGEFDHGNAMLDLNLAAGFMGSLNEEFIIASHASRGNAGSSVFANSIITEGIYEFTVNYSGSATILQITAVPEPSSIAMLGLASAVAFVRRRRS